MLWLTTTLKAIRTNQNLISKMFELICLILSMLVYTMYISIVCFKYKVPSCISETYYMLNNKWLFTAWLIAVAFLLFPAWVSISGVCYQFITFLSVVALCIVGLSPRYLDSQRISHIVFTCITLILSIIWNIVSGMYTIILILLVVCILLCFIFRSHKLFVAENIAFANIYISTLVKIILIL